MKKSINEKEQCVQTDVSGSFLYYVKNTETKSVVGILTEPNERGFVDGIYVNCGDDEKAILNGECAMRMKYFANNPKYDLSLNCH